MNQMIRCESLPFLKVNGEAAAEAPPCTEGKPESTPEFSDILNAELDDVPLDAEVGKEGDEEKEAEALAVYGVAPLLIQLAPLEIVQLKGAAAPNAVVQPQGEPIRSVTADEPVPSKTENPKIQIGGIELPGFQSVEEVTEKNVPSVPAESTPSAEQISGKGLQPAKKSNGMVAAQGPLMVMTSPQDESTLQPVQKLAVEQIETPVFQPVSRIEPLQNRSSRGEKTEISEVFAFDGDMAGMPRFEAISGEMELQPVRSVEPISVVEEIRRHVELLKSSTTEKLDVVLRPDPQTELRLQVEKVNGQIQVQVRCDRGDFKALEAHWGTIQNTLAPHGIRLEPLQQGGGAQLHQNGSNSSQNFSGQHSNEREERPAIFIEQEFGNREATRPKNSRGSAGRGWQSWA
jgi:hypothetical protein